VKRHEKMRRLMIEHAAIRTWQANFAAQSSDDRFDIVTRQVRAYAARDMAQAVCANIWNEVEAVRALEDIELAVAELDTDPKLRARFLDD